MIPSEFVRKWSDSRLRERQGSHEHFLDLCEILGEPKPAADDPLGDHYCFERGAEKVGGGDGWADVTNLYNQRPAWLAMAHQRLDAAVAYGWPADLSDEEVLAKLFALNQRGGRA